SPSTPTACTWWARSPTRSRSAARRSRARTASTTPSSPPSRAPARTSGANASGTPAATTRPTPSPPRAAPSTSRATSPAPSISASLGGQDGYVLKLAQTGAFAAVRRLGGMGDDYASAVAVDGGGDVVVAGSFELTADLGGGTTLVAQGRDGFLAKYTTGLAGT